MSRRGYVLAALLILSASPSGAGSDNACSIPPGFTQGGSASDTGATLIGLSHEVYEPAQPIDGYFALWNYGYEAFQFPVQPETAITFLVYPDSSKGWEDPLHAEVLTCDLGEGFLVVPPDSCAQWSFSWDGLDQGTPLPAGIYWLVGGLVTGLPGSPEFDAVWTETIKFTVGAVVAAAPTTWGRIKARY